MVQKKLSKKNNLKKKSKRSKKKIPKNKKSKRSKKSVKKGGNIQISDLDFTNVNSISELQDKYEKFKYNKKDLSENPCKKRENQDKKELMKHQAFIKEFMLNEKNHRGFLLFHEMGSGKTLASLGVSEALDRKVIVLLPSALKSNCI